MMKYVYGLLLQVAFALAYMLFEIVVNSNGDSKSAVLVAMGEGQTLVRWGMHVTGIRAL